MQVRSQLASSGKFVVMTEPPSRRIIFVVEDDPDVNRLIRVNLQAAGYLAEPFSNVISALAKARVHPPSLFLLDIMMPGEDGLGFCQHLRGMPEFKKTPIIFVTAKTSEDDRVLGFECGADDYITKPFSPRELVARVHAALRRHDDELAILRIGDLEIHPEAMRLRVRGSEKLLTTSEFRLLEMMARSPGRVFSRERIMRAIGTNIQESSPRAIDAFISKIRAKIEDDPRFPTYLLTVRGAGYRFAAK
jgi:DNA-binding response OmpR family regulator